MGKHRFMLIYGNKHALLATIYSCDVYMLRLFLLGSLENIRFKLFKETSVFPCIVLTPSEP